MMRIGTIVVTGALAFALAGCRSTAPVESTPAPTPNPVAAAQFERLKTMVGEWSAPSMAQAGQPAPRVRYASTGGGSAVVETIFVGGPHEMVTVYTMDHDQLVLTHYCVMGNQPHMRAAPAADTNAIRFECVDVGNGAQSEPHMHTGEFTFHDPNHVHVEWAMLADGALQPPVTLDLVRAN